MIKVEAGQRRWLKVFGATLGMLIGVAIWSSLRIPSFREPAFDFYAMKPDEIFNVYGLTRRQEGSVKLGFAEAYPAPEIALYGNHIAAFFAADAFGRPEDAEYFFNYFYANLSLPEIQRYLLRVEQSGHLPKRLILVQITPPNADNGRFIIDLGNELPPSVLLSVVEREKLLANPLQAASVAWELADNWLHEVMNYNTLILSVIQRGDYADRTVSPKSCNDETPTWLRRLPAKLQMMIAASERSRLFCLRQLWVGAIHRDGSQDPEFSTINTRYIVQNEDPLRETERALRAGDEREIARQMRAINAIGARHGVKVVFIVPPVYETDRHNSIANQIFDSALALIPDIAVIDNRGMSSNSAYFKSGVHPSPLYYQIVVDELRRRGFIS
jgi:hypothetical protein